MLQVREAHATIIGHVKPLLAESMPLDASALGLMLAEDVASDIDMPPFDKALMDGYAIRAADLPGEAATFAVIGEITAGQVARQAVRPGQALGIMTGAPLPSGADAVVIVERSRPIEGNQICLDGPVRSGQNVLFRAQEMRRGETVLHTSAVLRPQEFGLLAAVGRTAVRAVPRPSVAILSTGDELVEPSLTPGPGQIRNSNAASLMALTQQAGGRSRYLGIAPDEPGTLRRLLAEGMRDPVLILSGGVSAGTRDLVPAALAALGVRAHFHKVAMKPGKPVFFGTHGDSLVFGLPGNPASVMVCFALFVRPAIRALGGQAEPGPKLIDAVLEEDFAYQSDRPTYHPARLLETTAGRRVRPVPWQGSADLRSLTAANAFMVLEPADAPYRAGAHLAVLDIEA